MLSLVLAAALASAPAPRALSDANTVVHIARLDRLGGLHAFLERAGQHAALMKPEAWYAELSPLVPLDPSRPETLAAAGVEPSGPVTVSAGGDGRVACMRLADPAAFQAKAAAALEEVGERKSQVVRGVVVASAPREQGGEVGYALKGREVCAYVSTAGWQEALRKEAERLVVKAPAADRQLGALAGVVHLVWPGQGALGVDASATELRLEGVGGLPGLPGLLGAGSSPYGGLGAEGLLLGRARVSTEELGRVVVGVRSGVQRVCPQCPKKLMEQVARDLVEQLTGQVAWSVADVKVKGPLRRPEVVFFAPQHALVVEVRSAEAARAALEPLERLKGAKVLGDGYELEVTGGRLQARLKGRHLVLGNDEAVVQALVAKLPGPGGALAHGAEFTLDPKRLARALSRVSLFDVTGNPQLAAAFAAAVELGPLLSRSERMSGWVDSQRGMYRYSLTWALPPEKR